jgi:hypothetical protein
MTQSCYSDDDDLSAYFAECADRLALFLGQCDEARLQAMLQTVQQRLGTPAERPNDVFHARNIAHRLHNLLTAKRLRADLDALISKYPERPEKL